MRHLRRLIVPLAALVLLVPLLVLAAAPAAAQNDQTPKVYPLTLFKLANDTTRAPDNNNDGDPDRKWQVQVTAEPLSNCTPTGGNHPYTSFWMDVGDETAIRLSLEECVYRISATARDGLRPDCRHSARLGWGDPDVSGVNYVDDSILTLDAARPSDDIRVSFVLNPDRGCTSPNVTHFVIGGAGVVTGTPGTDDAALTALARRAAAVAEFKVRVQPDYAAGAEPRGCDRTTEFTLRGDGVRSSQPLMDAFTTACNLRARIVGWPAHFEILAGGVATFDGTVPNLLVDLGSLVRLEPARIAIVQDVRGSGNSGAVGYTVSRACGSVAVASPAPLATETGLYDGRFTVHAPGVAAFGATFVYPAVATSTTSATVVGCSVTVTITGVPTGCAVDGAHTRTLTWAPDNRINHFDFEFDIYCGDEAPPATTPGTPGDGDGTTDPSVGDAATAGADVRIVARLLASGKIEFGLQQGDGGTWGDRRFPRARLFPAGTAVGRWLVSSPITLSVADSPDSFAAEVAVRIVARRLANDRVEFGLQQQGADATWGDRMLPLRRYFPPSAAVDRWLGSSTLTLGG